jgi:hypothetical protein
VLVSDFQTSEKANLQGICEAELIIGPTGAEDIMVPDMGMDEGMAEEAEALDMLSPAVCVYIMLAPGA